MIDPTGYDVWYDVATEPFRPNWMFLVIPLFVAAGFATTAITTRSRTWSVLGPVGAASMIVLAAWSVWSTGYEHQLLQSALRRGEFAIVEGPVEDFRRGRPDCEEVSFRVQGRGINFSTCDIVSGFNGAGMRDFTGECAKIALVRVPALNAERIAWFGVRQCP